MSFGANLDLIPLTLVAKTREKLSLLCYANNIINHQKYNYTEFLEYSKGWVTTFYGDLKDYKSPEPLTKEELEVMREFKR